MGWRRDIPDHRDFHFRPKALMLKGKLVSNFPEKLDLSASLPPVLDQGDLGSCTANAIANAFKFDLIKQKAAVFDPSRLFIYYNERVIEGTTSIDNGAQIRDGMKTVVKQGVCPEAMLTYDPTKFADKPSDECFTEALKHQALIYQKVPQTLLAMKSAINLGYPFVAGFTVYDSFLSDKTTKTGVVPFPTRKESVVGGHAVLVCGYNDATQRFIVQNSWGTSWGNKGFFTIPFGYLANANLAGDFWMIRTVEI